MQKAVFIVIPIVIVLLLITVAHEIINNVCMARISSSNFVTYSILGVTIACLKGQCLEMI
jgi:hypothetical protein